MRLSPFSDVERSTPHLFLAREIRAAFPDAYIDMAFLPAAGDARLLEEAGLPLLIGTQSRRAIADFDMVLISNSWLLEQVNLPFLLSHSGIPLWASARDETWPPLILGGSNSTAAHALVSETGDCMADAIFFGEGEGSVGRIVRAWRAQEGTPKRERLVRISREVAGLWPAGDLAADTRHKLAAKVRKASCSDTADAPEGPAAPILPGPESATARLPITRGCPCLCSFCFEGYDRKPFRQIPAARVLDAARKLKRDTGADTLEVESFNLNTHTEIAALLHGLNGLFHRVNLMSQRVDILARTPGLLDLEIAADKRSYTLGIEGISERTRRFLHKSLTEEDIHRVLQEIHAHRTREVKLFYILTARETAEDFAEFADFAQWLKQLRLRVAAAPRLLFSFGMLVRMPFTPLRHDPPVLTEGQWRQGVGRAKSICETNGFEFRLAMRWRDYAAAQVLALGGHTLHSLLTRCADEGCVAEHGLPADAGRAVADWISLNADTHAGEKPRGFAFPFPFLDDEETKSFLHMQYTDAKAGRDTGYCRKGAEGPSECGECPGCTRIPRRTSGAGKALGPQVRELSTLMDRKHHLRPLYVTARLPRAAAGLGNRWAEAWLMRMLLSMHPDQLENVLAIREALLESSGVLGAETAWFGQTVVAVTAWDTNALAELCARAPGPFDSVVPAHEPGTFHAMRVRLELPSALFADAPESLAAFLRDSHAPVTLSRSEGAVRLNAHDKSLKKKMLLEGTCVGTADGFLFDLLIGPKMTLGKWLESFGKRGMPRRALAEITSIS